MKATINMLLIKFVLTTASAWLTFGIIDGNVIGWILVVGFLVTAGNYAIGDLSVLPKLGNITASLVDGGLGALVAYLIAFIFPAFVVSSASLVAFFTLVAIGEFFFHQYLRRGEKIAS